ncbi:MAG: T9SS type A sorting domain-containing protein [Flavobacteriales bacterium]|nr:T9SS type A sorting domain-containing protein [Flavobacteriales bacterium]
MRTIFFIILSSLLCLRGKAQTPTVGTLSNTTESLDGYTLFAPMAWDTTYLINNCGEVVNRWGSTHQPGASVYLLENGNLLHTKRVGNSTFTSGGSGGGVELFDWDGNLLWSYDVSSTSECQHHDVEYLPNGNVLMIVWESRSMAEAIQAGRDPNLAPSELWPDKIIEVEPSGATGGTIVWEWHAWDHLIQDVDNTKDNFGTVSDHPELININYPSNANSDWLHVNAVSYNPEFDQIAISSHNMNEIWIIDHSTTTAEAASHTGGTYGKGGDLLYRWGNPEVYDRGNPSDKKFYGQHNVHWITEGTDVGKLMVFNNGQNRTPGVSYSTVDIIDPPVDGNGNYTEPASGQTFLPTDLYWSYEGSPNTDFFSANISGAHRLSNNNTVICEGRNGHFFEITPDKEIVWEYISPVTQTGIVDQGTDPVNGNSVFRCTRYTPEYAAFVGRDLTPGSVLELNSNVSCTLHSTATAINERSVKNNEVLVTVNSGAGFLTVSEIPETGFLSVYDSFGRAILQHNVYGRMESISTSFWSPGIYYVSIIFQDRKVTRKVFVM